MGRRLRQRSEVSMEDPGACPDCGLPLIEGRCTACGQHALFRFVHREIAVLTIIIAITAGMFVVTRSVAHAHHALRQGDAAAWYRIGRARLESGHAREAAAALRKAASIDRNNRGYRFSLATALAAAGDHDAARQVLLGLRQVAPENPDVNLRLARLESDRNDPDAAIRYYQNALYGGHWGADQVTERRLVRLEFIEYLLKVRQSSRALGELLVFEGNIPDNPESRVQVARLFREAGDAARALAEYELVLHDLPRRADALAGAGEAAYTLGDYSRAQRYLRAAPDSDPKVRELRAMSLLMLTRDPLAPRLTYAERRRRLQLGLKDATGRLQACPAEAAPSERGSLIAEADALARTLVRGRREEVIDALDTGVDLFDRIERAAAPCGPLSDVDRALLLIGRRHPLDQQ